MGLLGSCCWVAISQPGKKYDTRRMTQELLQQCNQARRAVGLGPLEMEPDLSQAAQAHAQEMVELDYFSHGSPLPDHDTLRKRLRLAGCQEMTAGENLFRCQEFDAADVPLETVESWLASPAHRANLLHPRYNRVGFGIVKDRNRFTITQDLAYEPIEVLEKTVQGTNLTLRCQVQDGPRSGAIFYQDHRIGDWQAEQEGVFTVQTTLPGPGPIQLGQSLGEREWAIETEIVLPSSPP